MGKGMPEQLSKELQKMKDDELASFIRDTISRLHIVADHLESYVTEDVAVPEVGFDTGPPSNGEEANEETVGN